MITTRRRLKGVVTLLALTLSLAGCNGAEQKTSDTRLPKNLIILSLDTVRPDHLAFYGYDRPTTPDLDKFASRGVVFENAFTSNTNTGPSHSTMFTGFYETVHGVRKNGYRLPEKFETLAEILSAHGFRTAGFVSGVTMTARSSGLDQGFSIYDDHFRGKRRDGKVANDDAIRFLQEADPSRPYFLFVHYYDAHGKYDPTPEYLAKFHSNSPGPEVIIPRYQEEFDESGTLISNVNPYIDRYDAKIRYINDLISKLLAHVDLSNTVVFLVSDHGETLGERAYGFDHGARLFDEQLRTILTCFGASIRNARERTRVDSVDLLPTILDLFGIPKPISAPLQGSSFVSLLQDGRSSPRYAPSDYSFASARVEARRLPNRHYDLDSKRKMYSVRGARWKLIDYPGVQHDYFELYDLSEDPGETKNLFDEQPRVARELINALNAWNPRRHDPVRKPSLDPDIEEKLRSLGYLGGG